MASLTIRPFVPADYSIVTGQETVARAPAFTGLIEGTVAACAGIDLFEWGGVGSAWAAIGPLGRQHSLLVARGVLRGLQDLIRQHGLVRVEADALADFARARRWLGWMGFEDEGVMRLRGPRGETMIRYALFPKSPV